MLVFNACFHRNCLLNTCSHGNCLHCIYPAVWSQCCTVVVLIRSWTLWLLWACDCANLIVSESGNTDCWYILWHCPSAMLVNIVKVCASDTGCITGLVVVRGKYVSFVTILSSPGQVLMLKQKITNSFKPRVNVICYLLLDQKDRGAKNFVVCYGMGTV